MTSLERILSELRDTDATLAELKSLAAAAPRDEIVSINIHAVDRRRDFLERQLSSLLLRSQMDLIDYHLEHRDGSRCSATGVFESIAAFQAMLTVIFDALPASATGGDDAPAAELVTLAFSGGSPNSAAIVLGLLNDRLLLMPSAAEAALEAALALLTADATARLRLLAREHGVAAVAACRRWADASVRNDFAIALRWRKAGEFERVIRIPLNRAWVLRNMIDELRDEQTETVECDGEVIGIDHFSGDFRLETAGGTVISGRLSPDFAREGKVSLRGIYSATLLRNATLRYGTATTTERWELLALRPPKDLGRNPGRPPGGPLTTAARPHSH